MRPDIYTKSILTVIAILLAMLVGKQYFSPDSVAYAQGSFAGIQHTAELNPYGAETNVHSFFDTRNGDLWYWRPVTSQWTYEGRVTAFGQPVANRGKPAGR